MSRDKKGRTNLLCPALFVSLSSKKKCLILLFNFTPVVEWKPLCGARLQLLRLESYSPFPSNFPATCTNKDNQSNQKKMIKQEIKLLKKNKGSSAT